MSATAVTFAPFKGLVQLAYVTTDFDRAIAEFGERYGVPGWMQMRDLDIETGPGRGNRIHVGLAWVGPTQLEIIQLVSGDDSIYRWRLPETGYGLSFHHMAQLFDAEAELEALEEQVAKDRIPVAIRGSSAGGLVRYLYTDQRSSLGHFVEHIWYAPDVRAALWAQIPRN
jgi:hypothetical protein